MSCIFILRLVFWYFFFFKLKTAYEWCISDWSSDVCSSDLGHHSPWAGYIRFLPVLEVCAMQGVGRSVRGADKRDHRGEKFDVLSCHFQFWDKAKCFTEWPHQSTRGKVAPSIILRCYELACLPRDRKSGV